MLTKEQRKLRRAGIGGSEIGAVVGLSPYATALDVWRAKVEGLEFDETPAMKRGRILEPAVAQWYAEETGAELLPGETMHHPIRPVVLATPDRIAVLNGERRVLEIKTAHFRMLSQWGAPGTDEIPQTYLCQVQWEMAVTGLTRADLAVLIAGDDFRIYRIEWDADLFGMLATEAEKFWADHVLTGIPPPIDGSESCAAWIADRFPRDRGQELVATSDAERWAAQLFEARQMAERAEAAKDEAENQLKALMGDASFLQGNGWRVSWKAAKDSAKTDWEALAKQLTADLCDPEDVPKMLAEYVPKFTTTKPGSRRFVPKKEE